MKTPEYITIEFLSDSTFSSASRGAEIVDVEISHDSLGLPTISGKTIRGLLRESWILMREQFPELDQAFRRVFGNVGDLTENSILRIGDAQTEDDVREWIRTALNGSKKLTPEHILSLLTTIRVQTAVNRNSMAPDTGSLRFIRVALRGLKLVAPLNWFEQPTENDLHALALCLLATRHGGLGRNRGRGHIRMLLDGDQDMTMQYINWGGNE